MEYVYGALLLHSAGKPVSDENLKKVLTAAGVKADDARVKARTASLEAANIDEAIKTAVAAPAAAPAPAAEKKAKKEGKEEEEGKEEGRGDGQRGRARGRSRRVLRLIPPFRAAAYP